MLAFVINSFIALGLVGIGVRNLLRYFIKKKFVSTKAKVIFLKKQLDADYLMEYPIIKYSNGREEIITKVDFGMSLFQWKKGDELQVFYDSDNPKKYFIWGSKVKILSALLIITGTIFFIIGLKFI